MKITSITIQSTNRWRDVSADNPLRAVVKLSSDDSTVECVLSDESMRRMLDVCADEIAAQARMRVDEFCAAVTAIEGEKSSLLIEGNA